jgi:hypothetical protein
MSPWPQTTNFDKLSFEVLNPAWNESMSTYDVETLLSELNTLPPLPPDDDEGDHLPERPEGGNNMLLPCLICIGLCSLGILATAIIEIVNHK